jgi:hypothetical protein
MATQRFHAGIILVIGTVGLVISVLATTLLSAYQQIPNVGVVKAVRVGVYEDAKCSTNVTSINWGILEPGAVTNFTVYIKNEGNTPLILNMTTDDWEPENASIYITLKWNLEGSRINPSDVIPANLTLSISPNIEGITNFSFEIFIVGIEAS